MTKKTLKIIHDLKKKKQGITSLTSYDASFAKLADQCGVDILLIGDSLGEVIKGDKNPAEYDIDHDSYEEMRSIALEIEDDLLN